MKIKNLQFESAVFLAPMAGVTDSTFRVLARKMGAGLTYSEMVSAKGIVYNNSNTRRLLQISEKEKPVAVQLFGREPNIIKEAIRQIDGYGFCLYDINMGCPAPKVVKNDEGSALLKEPKLIGEIIKKASRATNKPVTIKIRSGFDLDSINALENAKIAEESGAAAIAVHGRTRSQQFRDRADWEIVAKIKESIKIPVIGSGDIITPKQAKARLESCDAVMIGRAAIGNPFIFREINYYLETGNSLHPPTLEEIKETIIEHVNSVVSQKGEKVGALIMRRYISYYTKGLENSAKLREQINNSSRKEQIIDIIKSL
jgi:nifR3 family TIM-barrel protein